jgi:hypothetical protein
MDVRLLGAPSRCDLLARPDPDRCPSQRTGRVDRADRTVQRARLGKRVHRASRRARVPAYDEDRRHNLRQPVVPVNDSRVHCGMTRLCERPDRGYWETSLWIAVASSAVPVDILDDIEDVQARSSLDNDQVRRIDASQARTLPGSTVISIIAGSISSTRQPSLKLTRISSCWMRRGPQSPGSRSLKQSM